MVKKTLVLLFFFTTFMVASQSTFVGGWLPKVNTSTKLSEKTKWVNSIEAREIIYNEDFQFTHSLVDVSSIFSFKTDLDQSVNVGYILRFKEGETIHRTLQHFNLVQNLNGIKLGHRLGFEQFFQSQVTPQYRTRYRATFQKALSGKKVDVKEWYVKLSNEYLYQFNKQDFEIRLAPYLGYQLSEKDKLEFGFDYRWGQVFDLIQNNSLWFRTTWYISL
ncbi:DUF2490 domain-containing protein [Tenacibaculum tangerinum]|uniref:DUF2490 domain-containing protein n=1 Tax=Tenacibaculum tangerinum TaxID=3038772 RepID=A0ABY8KXU1_9FLAO|nr:DUF2490 domain-containing protein [Tenacibaculum tangerinum]WGH74066.1 DUF2490 domain-containing protein [Tenacibaculum tangerinum]